MANNCRHGQDGCFCLDAAHWADAHKRTDAIEQKKERAERLIKRLAALDAGELADELLNTAIIEELMALINAVEETQ
jgi:hypothetical protein